MLLYFSVSFFNCLLDSYIKMSNHLSRRKNALSESKSLCPTRKAGTATVGEPEKAMAYPTIVQIETGAGKSLPGDPVYRYSA